MTTEPEDSLSQLTPEQKARLESLETEIRFDKITVAYSIEDRDAEGRKKWSMYSPSVCREGGGGWTAREAQIVSVILSKHVIQTTYRDVAKRKIMRPAEAAEEAAAIIRGYDMNLANLLKSEK
jgi:hypothetical protein